MYNARSLHDFAEAYQKTDVLAKDMHQAKVTRQACCSVLQYLDVSRRMDLTNVHVGQQGSDRLKCDLLIACTCSRS